MGCNRAVVRENQPSEEEIGITQIAKSDIDNVLEIHVNETRI